MTHFILEVPLVSVVDAANPEEGFRVWLPHSYGRLCWMGSGLCLPSSLVSTAGPLRGVQCFRQSPLHSQQCHWHTGCIHGGDSEQPAPEGLPSVPPPSKPSISC